jgi:hypothetical protein
MSRAGLKIEDGGFPIYADRNLPKINAWRRAASMPDLRQAPVLTKGQVLFSTGESAHHEPRSCFNCPMYFESAARCKYFGGRIKLHKFTVGEQDKNPIEYWPVCGYWTYGKPSEGEPQFLESKIDPEDAGLGWTNAPRPGMPLSGTCCGGGEGGDDCDYWFTAGDEAKWNASIGTCRVLQTLTANMDCCAAWTDDDWIPWQTAQQFQKDKS